MASLNKVLLIGHVGRDVEIRTTADGKKVANFSLATSDRWTDKNTSERKERTEWHRVVVFNDRLVEIVEKYVKKGSKLWIEGALQTRKWSDRQKVDHYTTEIVLQQFRGEVTLLDRAASNRPPAAESADDYGNTSTYDGAAAVYPAASASATQVDQDLNDEIPF